jgi:ribosomal protein L11 methyltransferase
MCNFIQIQIRNLSSQQSEILVAQLSEIGFDGFEEGENFLNAYIEDKKLDKDELQKIISSHQLSFKKKIIEQKNWNEEWEKNFEPVIVEDFVAVRAEFHQPIRNVQHEIIITPKMSFGTGHHATTYMMMQAMRNLNFKNKAVLDFGTGTGILAILAEKLGASSIIAIDNDEWSINNAKENIEKNQCKNIQLFLSNAPNSSRKFDIILANINKNVIITHFTFLSRILNKNGRLLVSGILHEDEPEMIDLSYKIGLKPIQTLRRNQWSSIEFNP